MADEEQEQHHCSRQHQGTSLTNLYLKLTQAAYAIDAFPIGTVLSIGPILLHEQKNVPLGIIGLLMAGGEALGIIAMKIAEMSTNGFILSRPHDLHLIIGLISLSLILMPFWPENVWYLTGIAMMLVQILNSASKPVVGESLYRLAVLMKKEPSKVFAQANMFRRIGNACIGSITPLIYGLSPEWSFYGVGAVMLLFLAILLLVALKIHASLRDDQSKSNAKSEENAVDLFVDNGNKDIDNEENRYSTIGILKSFMIINESTISASQIKNISFIRNSSRGTTRSRDSKNKEILSQITWTDLTIHDSSSKSSAELEDIMEEEENLSPTVDEKELKIFKILHFFIVHIFSFWDAAISRLPFAFLTVAIAKEFSITLAAGVLFAYQISTRAISQFIQVSCCTPLVGYILNLVALVVYVVLVAYIEIVPSGNYWYIPFGFLGFAETLAIQQFYLIRLFGADDGLDEGNLELRHAIKASHTGTGIGSMVAFFASSRVYASYGITGVAYLGLGIQYAKIVTNIIIDHLLYNFEEAIQKHVSVSCVDGEDEFK